jgi:hypothetical protein
MILGWVKCFKAVLSLLSKASHQIPCHGMPVTLNEHGWYALLFVTILAYSNGKRSIHQENFF